MTAWASHTLFKNFIPAASRQARHRPDPLETFTEGHSCFGTGSSRAETGQGPGAGSLEGVCEGRAGCGALGLDLAQRLTNFFGKGPGGKYFRLSRLC